MFDANWMYLFTFFNSIANLYAFSTARKHFKFIHPIAHSHFCKIFYHIYICIFMFSTCTLIMALSLMFSEADAIFEHIYFYTNWFATLSQNTLSALFLLLFLERVGATLHRTFYENFTQIWVIYFGILLCYMFGIWNILAWNVWRYGFFMGRVCYGIDICTVLGTFILWKINQHLKKLHPSSHLMLTQRYQIFENIRTIRFALPYLSIGIFAIIFGGLISEYFGPENKAASLFYFCLINLFIPFMLGFERFYNYLSNSEKLEKVFSYFSSFRRHRVGSLASDFTKTNAGEFHFEQLRSAWK